MTAMSVSTLENLHVRTIPEPPDRSKAEDILKAFNTWAFKREQPSDLRLLREFIVRAERQEEPLSFVAYWGKGPRDEIAEPDLQCIQYMKQMLGRIDAIHEPGTELHLILTDSHARLNGHKVKSINKYFKAVEAVAAENGFSSWRLQALTQAMRPALRSIPRVLPQESKELLLDLEKSAAKWYRGGNSVDEGAKQYFDMNMVEKRVIERVFPNSIFITYNSSQLRALFPTQLPIFYMYSIKKGVGVKPWFQ